MLWPAPQASQRSGRPGRSKLHSGMCLSWSSGAVRCVRLRVGQGPGPRGGRKRLNHSAVKSVSNLSLLGSSANHLGGNEWEFGRPVSEQVTGIPGGVCES